MSILWAHTGAIGCIGLTTSTSCLCGRSAMTSYCSVNPQIVVKLIAFRLKYFTHKFEVFDGMVVVISWILDIASL